MNSTSNQNLAMSIICKLASGHLPSPWKTDIKSYGDTPLLYKETFKVRLQGRKQIKVE